MPSRKKQRRNQSNDKLVAAPDDEEMELERMLFGGDKKLSSSTSTKHNVDNNASDADVDVASNGLNNGPESSAAVSTPLFWMDNDGDNEEGVDEKSSAANKTGRSKQGTKRAWVDDDNDDLQVNIASVNRTRKLRVEKAESVVDGNAYSERLKSQFNRANAHTGAAKWSKIDDENSSSASGSSDEESDDDVSSDVLRSTSATLSSGGKGGLLSSGELRVLRVKDANAAAPSKNASIQSVRFMRRGARQGASSSSGSTPLLLTAGLDKTLRLFSIDGKTNRKVQSVFVRDLPIQCADFSPTRDEVILSGRRSFFYVYDMNASKAKRIPKIVGRDEKSLERFVTSPDGKWITFLGNDGYAIMVDGKTKRWVCDLKMNGSIRAASFSPDGSTLQTAGGDGQVYLWDLRTRRCIDRHSDEGAVHSTALATSVNMYAAGADSGVVNLYRNRIGDRKTLSGTRRRGPIAVAMQLQRPPFKSIMSLTTRVDTLRFNHDGQILAIASHMKKDSLRLVHTETGKPFANWPTSSTPLRYVTDVDFSPGGGLMAIGNDRGRVLLYRLLHYTNL